MKVIGEIVIGFIFAAMVIFSKDFGGGNSLKAWMDAYEKFLYAQMEDNFRREREAKEKARAEETQSYVEVGETLGADSDQQREAETEAVLQPTQVETEASDTNINTGTEEVVRQVEVQPETVAETAPTQAPQAEFPAYMVNGQVLEVDIQRYMYQRLCEQGIPYFFPYAILICYQESRFNRYAENPNGRDKGLLQYRVEYVPWMDWTNPYQQIDYFAAQMGNRARAGCDILSMVSRHKSSDYGPYDEVYVQQVMQWMGVLVQIQ